MIDVINLIPQKILFCGLGSIGRRHVRIANELYPNIELASMRSGYGRDCPELRLMNGRFSELSAAIDWGPQAAVISSPAPIHLEQALILANKGIPILIEKPIGTGKESPEKWNELIQLSNRIPILIGYVLRHDPCTAYLKEVLISEKLGKVLEADFYCGSWLPNWRPESDYRITVSANRNLGGGVLLELSHEIDLAHLFLGELKVAYALIKQSGILEIDVEDQAVLFANNLHGTLVSIRLNFCSVPAKRETVLRCEKGELVWDLTKGTVKTFTANRPVEIFNSTCSVEDRYRLQLKHFISCISSKVDVKCGVSDGLNVLKTINQARIKALYVPMNLES